MAQAPSKGLMGPPPAKRRRIGQNSTTSTRSSSAASGPPADVPLHLRKLYVPDVGCPDCRGGGNVVEDNHTGAAVCTQCGLVVEKQCLSEQSEWRTFAEDDRSGPDPNRVGRAMHYLLHDEGDLSTAVVDNQRLQNLQESTSQTSKNKKMGSAIKDISKYCQRLSLTREVQNAAGELFKQLLEIKEFKSRKDFAKVATCVYMAAKQCKSDRPLKELCEEFGIARGDVRKIHSEIKKHQASGVIKMPKIGRKIDRTSTAEIYAGRYCQELQLPASVHQNVKKIVNLIEKNGCLAGKQPQTIAGCAVYFGCIVNGDATLHRSYKEVASVARVAEGTLQNTFRRFLYPIREEIVPPGYGDILRVQNLQNV